jgi:hypothetical protein
MYHTLVIFMALSNDSLNCWHGGSASGVKLDNSSDNERSTKLIT